MRLILKLLILIIVLAFLAQQAFMYISIVIDGPYTSVAPIFNAVLVAVVWPLVVLLGAWFVVKWLFRLIDGKV